MLRFARPEYLYLLCGVPVLILFYVYVFRMKRSALERFGNIDLVNKLAQATSRRRQILKVTLIVSAFCLMTFSLSRPQIGTKYEEVKREGQDIIIALDVSESMLAEDIEPSRLEKSKHEIRTIIEKLEGDRIGLIIFAGEAFVQCPLTLDYGAAKMFLDVIDTGVIPLPGTNIGAAIELAIKSFEQQERKHKILLLITDGEDHYETALKMAEAAEREGIIIYTVGIGSREGVPIPEFDDRGNRIGFKKDDNGEVITTKLDEVLMEKIALQTNGKYYRATPGEAELTKIYEAISGLEKKELGSKQFTQFEDRFQYVIFFSLIFVAGEIFISERKKIREEWRGRFVL